MIYFDNAATTMVKPPVVARAMAAALSSFGGAGRGVHPASLAAGRAVYDARSRIASLLGASSSACVSFTINATMALNIAIQGLAAPGMRIVTTAASHNSVLRPLFRLHDEAGCVVDIAPIRADGSLDFESYEAMLASGDVTLVVATHASNVTGDVYDVARMASCAHDAGALFVLDAAQTAGALPLSMMDLGVDVLCFTGHKSLLGPQGTGGLCIAPDIEIPPLLEGGSGVHSFDERHPRFMPEALEAGTLNAHGLAGLAAAVSYIKEKGIDVIASEVAQLTSAFEKGARSVPGVQIIGGNGGAGRCGIVAVSVEGTDSSVIADMLAYTHDICTRAGAHCAPLMHKSIGSEQSGVVRFSFSHLNTMDEVEAGLEALEDCVKALR